MQRGLAGRLGVRLGGLLAAECRWPWPAALRPAERLCAAVLFGLVFTACFYLLLELGALFDRGDRVSLFFPVAGLCLMFGYALGPVYLPVPVIAVFLAEGWVFGSPSIEQADLHIIRQALIYGVAGVLLRVHLMRHSGTSATYHVGVLVIVAILAVFANMGPALWLFAWEQWLVMANLPTVALVFFLGDLSGLLLVVPPTVLLMDCWLERRRSKAAQGLATRRDRVVALGLLAAAVAIVVFALLGFAGGDNVTSAMAPMLLPILAGAMFFGYAVGVVLYSIAAAFLLGVAACISDPPNAVSLHTMLIVCGFATLVVGAATSDRSSLAARLDASVAERTRQLNTKNANLIRINAELRTVASTDHLTRLPNRRAFDTAFEERLAAGGGSLGLLLIDIDRFKLINDRYGHQVGDQALMHVARLLTAAVRNGDLVARVGGEEFAIICRAVDDRQLRELADRLRRIIRTTPLRCSEAGSCLDVRISIGGAVVDKTDDAQRVLHAADGALYAAKRAGRDRTHIAAPPDLPPIVDHAS